MNNDKIFLNFDNEINPKSDDIDKNSKNEKNLNVQEHPDRSVFTGNLAKNINTQDLQNQNQAPSQIKVSRFRNDKKENKVLSEKENIQLENKQILDRFHNDIFSQTTSKIITSINKYSEDVTSNEIKEKTLKIINDENTSKDQKNNLYFKLKARKC